MGIVNSSGDPVVPYIPQQTEASTEALKEVSVMFGLLTTKDQALQQATQVTNQARENFKAEALKGLRELFSKTIELKNDIKSLEEKRAELDRTHTNKIESLEHRLKNYQQSTEALQKQMDHVNEQHQLLNAFAQTIKSSYEARDLKASQDETAYLTKKSELENAPRPFY